MRKSRVIAVMFASLVSVASVASAQVAAPRAGNAGHRMGPGMMARHGRGGGELRGIKLSDAEKAKLKEIHQKYRTEAQALHNSLKPAMDQARAARQKGDTAAARKVWQDNKGARDQMQSLRDREQAEIRAALSPDNQKLFDANVARLKERREAMKDRREDRKEKRDRKGALK